MRSQIGRRIVWMLAILISAGGIYVNYHLSLKHAKSFSKSEEPEDSTLDKMCSTMTAKSDCEKVIQSPWGEIKGIPTAEIGMAYFICVLAWVVLIGPVSASQWYTHLVFVVGTLVGFGGSVFFAIVMLTGLEHTCPLCLLTHVSNLLLLVAAILLWPRSPRTSVVDYRATGDSEAEVGSRAAHAPSGGDWPHWWMVGVTPVVALLGILLSHNHLKAVEAKQQVEAQKQYADSQKDFGQQFMLRWQYTYTHWAIGQQFYINVEDRPVIGPETARHTVIVFSDFECPACKHFEEFYRTKVRSIADRVGGTRLIFKHWPICQDCNAYAARNLHPAACRGARAAEAARMIGGDEAFWKMHDLLFARQEDWKKKPGSELFEDMARSIGLDVKRFQEAYDSDEALERIKADIEEGEQLDSQMREDARKLFGKFYKVSGTPAVFVDYKRLLNRGHPGAWQRILQERTVPAPEKPGIPSGGEEGNAEDGGEGE